MSCIQLLSFKMIFLELSIFKTPTPCLINDVIRNKPGVFHSLVSSQKTKSIYTNILYRFVRKLVRSKKITEPITYLPCHNFI